MTKGYLLENCWHELSESRYELDLTTISVLSFFLFVGIFYICTSEILNDIITRTEVKDKFSSFDNPLKVNL